MATFTELCSDVYTITNKSDLVSETELAVKAATLKLHGSENYFKDLYETILAFDPAGYFQSIEYRTLFPRYRSLKYLKKFDVDTSETGTTFDILSPDQLIDDYGILKTNVCYVAGSVIQTKSDTEDDYMSIGMYMHPSVASDTYSSWIALEFPYAIVYEAASQIFSLLENTKAKDSYKGFVADMLIEIRGHNIVAQGY